jgi:DNA-binding LacI/PurR family transcriptional regulator
MPREELNSDLPEIEGVPTSIRNERIDLIVAGLDDAGLTANVVTVKSYLASQALEIYQKHPSARAYVCLSDELAVGIRQLLFATGQDPSNRIVGFDDSELADAYGITSISQHLTDLGEVIQRVFMTFFREQAGGAPWPEFQECCIQTQLTLRGY